MRMKDKAGGDSDSDSLRWGEEIRQVLLWEIKRRSGGAWRGASAERGIDRQLKFANFVFDSSCASISLSLWVRFFSSLGASYLSFSETAIHEILCLFQSVLSACQFPFHAIHRSLVQHGLQ